jgi:hypothetical protein
MGAAGLALKVGVINAVEMFVFVSKMHEVPPSSVLENKKAAGAAATDRVTAAPPLFS